MTRLDIDTITLFGGNIDNDNCICFYGDKKDTWSILYKRDLSSVKSLDFYKIINTNNSLLITNIYVFNLLTDAIIFYTTRGTIFFNNALIIIVDHQSKKEVAELLRENLSNSTASNPKLHFYHTKEKADLYLFYLELYGLVFYYQINYLSDKLSLKIQSKKLQLELSFSELNKLRFFLGINDKTFRIKNNILNKNNINNFIIW